MKRLLLLGCLLSPAAAQEPEPEPPPPPTLTEPTAAPDREAAEEPEDQLEALLDRAGKFLDQKKRAKCGGALLEAAELVQDLAQPQPQRVIDEVATLRQLALLAAQGDLQPNAIDFAASRACVKLALLQTDKATSSYENGKPRDAGQQWFRAVLFTERSLDHGGYGLKDAGIDTLAESKKIAESLAQGDLIDTDSVRPLLSDMRTMVTEIGRSLAAKAGVDWDPAPKSKDPRSLGGVLEDTSHQAADKLRGGVHRLGDALRRWQH